MKLYPLVICLLGMCCSVFAETRLWTMADGKTVEAEFVSVIAGNVSLRSLAGKIVKVPVSQFSDADREYIELAMPPRLEIDTSKSSEQRIFPDSLSELPRSFYFTLTAKITQKSTLKYTHPLDVEFFFFIKEIDGGKDIIADYKQATFTLQGSGSTFELESDTVELPTYSLDETTRGEEYSGYLIVVTDARGEVIAHEGTKETYWEHIENLRKVPVGKWIDEECNRTYPTRPKPFYK